MTVRDEFFWLGEINKATLVINSRQGLLPMPIAEEAAKALREVLADGDADPTKRAKTYITFEPLMLKKADPVITLMHAGRSSQDMHATYRSAILRDHVLEVGDALNAVLDT
ncbi:MAG: argininosuccinate lyase, partial [Parasutterella excrementihominis]